MKIIKQTVQTQTEILEVIYVIKGIFKKRCYQLTAIGLVELKETPDEEKTV